MQISNISTPTTIGAKKNGLIIRYKISPKVSKTFSDEINTTPYIGK